jgi:hypothetical protein
MALAEEAVPAIVDAGNCRRSLRVLSPWGWPKILDVAGAFDKWAKIRDETERIRHDFIRNRNGIVSHVRPPCQHGIPNRRSGKRVNAVERSRKRLIVPCSGSFQT